MKLLTVRSLLLATAAGLLLCVAALGVRSREWIHPSTWDPDHPPWSSDAVDVAVWGWPLYCAVDHPWQGRVGRLEPLSEVALDRAAGNWLFFTLLVLYGRGLWAVFSRREIVPQPLAAAALTAPMTVFLVVQSLLPWAMSTSWAAPTIGKRILDSTVPTLVVTIAAYLLMLIVGLPAAWLLDRSRRLRPAVVAPVGAVMGVLPPVVIFHRELAEAWTELPGLFLIGATAGSLCALTFWAFSGRRERRSAAA